MKAGAHIKNLANYITLSRIAFAIVMACVAPFSAAFWICYVCGGVSDLLDGPLARRLHTQRDTGAKLDSAADLVFALSLFVVALRSAAFPIWLWACMAAIALLKLIGYGVGYAKYRTFSGLHTVLNKLTGGCAFAFPLLCVIMGFTLAGSIVCGVAFLAAAEELVITAKSAVLRRDRKSIFEQKENKND